MRILTYTVTPEEDGRMVKGILRGSLFVHVILIQKHIRQSLHAELLALHCFPKIGCSRIQGYHLIEIDSFEPFSYNHVLATNLAEHKS